MVEGKRRGTMGLFIKLVIKNTLRHGLRTALTLAGILIAVMAFVLLRTVVDAWYAGANATSAKRLVTRNAISLVFPLPLSYLNRIRQVDGVVAVTYANWFGGIYIDEKNFFPQFAIDESKYFDIYPEYLLDETERSAFLHDRMGAIAGRKLARQYDWEVGDVIPIRGTIYPGTWSFVLRGIYRGVDKTTDETQFFFHWDNLNETLKQRGAPGIDKVGIYIVEIEEADRAAEISAAIDRQFENSLAETLTETEKAFQLGFVAMSEAILTAIEVVSLLVIGIMLAVMANTMAMTARERKREYAVLKALGFGPWFIAALIGCESLIISSLGGVAGIAASYPLAEAFALQMGTLFPVFEISSMTVLTALATAIGVGIGAAVFPVWRAVKAPVGQGLGAVG